MKNLTIYLLLIFSVACSNKKEPNNKVTNINAVESNQELPKQSNKSIVASKAVKLNSTILKLKLQADTSDVNYYFNYLDSNNRTIHFFSGYTEYNEDKYGFNNPAYIKIFADTLNIYDHTFKAYSEIRITKKGTYTFSEKLDFYLLEYGLESCDYINVQQLFFVKGNKCQLINELSTQSTDFASKYIEYIFPSDSSGVENHVLTVEKIDYFTEGNTNKRDTLIYKYLDGNFKEIQ